MKYRAVLMDADDTIFDFQTGNRRAIEQLMNEIGYHSPQRFEEYQAINHACWAALERGEMNPETLKVIRFQRFLEKYQIDCNPSEIAGRFIEILGCQHMLLPYAGDVVRAISEKMPVIIVTNGITDVQKNRINLSPVKNFISGMVISEEIGFSKPRPEIFRYALNQWKLKPADVLVVGDSVTSDIAGANNAGIDCCWYNPHNKQLPKGIHTDYVVSDIRDIVQIALQ